MDRICGPDPYVPGARMLMLSVKVAAPFAVVGILSVVPVARRKRISL